jgi:hypothetical protein
MAVVRRRAHYARRPLTHLKLLEGAVIGVGNIQDRRVPLCGVIDVIIPERPCAAEEPRGEDGQHLSPFVRLVLEHLWCERALGHSVEPASVVVDHKDIGKLQDVTAQFKLGLCRVNLAGRGGMQVKLQTMRRRCVSRRRGPAEG